MVVEEGKVVVVVVTEAGVEERERGSNGDQTMNCL